MSQNEFSILSKYRFLSSTLSSTPSLSPQLELSEKEKKKLEKEEKAKQKELKKKQMQEACKQKSKKGTETITLAERTKDPTKKGEKKDL